MSECSCIAIDDYDPPKLFAAVLRTARKEHSCGECGRVITAGERYEHVSGIWDGFFDHHKTCPDCLSVRNEFFCSGYIFGEVWERLTEHLRDTGGQVDGDCLVRLTPEARAEVCDLIEEIWAREDGDE